ncbi:carotenoid biosynthesis protein [Fulvivirga lutea]|uniref:Carotenoid biosynthesis protein n=1 Tax=Fulvivirga lutea TaxID=2810512 RepID=A0A974WEQ3_9BACT|nr:carotenoid biosynthesis protein [Fulvivirga lutea]QSE96038.1 carotenoid biosynthesis protein [Fulvivirga lutea]
MIDYILHRSKYVTPKALVLAFVWIVHLAGIIGITLGYQEWFISKTNFNLILLCILSVVYFPVDNLKVLLGLFLMFTIGFFSEWLGVNYGLIFGDYHYGNNLGIKVGGVPLLIGMNWALLTIITGALAQKIFTNKLLRVITATLLMLVLDVFLENSAPIFDFWYWHLGYPPLQNYIGWFAVALILQVIYLKLRIKGDSTFSLHLYAAQLIFFVYFYGFYHL